MASKPDSTGLARRDDRGSRRRLLIASARLAVGGLAARGGLGAVGLGPPTGRERRPAISTAAAVQRDQRGRLGNRVAALGASNVAAVGAGPTIELDGFVGWAWLLGGDRVRTHPPEAMGGFHLADVRDLLLPRLLGHDPPPDWCIVHAGTNDAGGADPAAMLATAAEIFDRLLDAGVVPIATSLPPQGTTTNLPTLAEFNRGVERLAADRGVPFADLFAAVVDPATGTFRAGMNLDGVHFSPAGARRAGQVVADVLRANLPPWTPPLPTTADPAAASLLPNPLMLADANDDGLPDGWSVASGPTTAAWSLVDGGGACDGNWFEMTGAGDDRPTVVTTAPVTVPAGQVVAVGYRCQVLAGSRPPAHSVEFRTGTGGWLRRVGYGQGYVGEVPPHATYHEARIGPQPVEVRLQVSISAGGALRLGQVLLRVLSEPQAGGRGG